MKWLLIWISFLCFTVAYRPLHRHKLTPSQRSMRLISKPIHPTIQIIIHIDQALTQKMRTQYGPYTRRKLKQSSMNIIRNAQKIFDHPSLNQKVQLKLIKIRFLKNNSRTVTMSANATEYLKSYCQWQSGKKMERRYYSVLLTGLDIFVEGKRNGTSSTGRGYMRGVCNVKKSCALLAWRPKNMAYLVAHEIAHSMGVPHDGKPLNSCKGQGYMMTAKYNPHNNPTSWTHCSSRIMKTYLRTRKMKCLWPDFYETRN